MLTYVLVALGSAIGGVARFWVGGLVAARVGPGFPVGTILINVLGSAVIGAAARAVAQRPDRPDAGLIQSFVMVGLCGGFTTFSAFSLQTMELLRAGQAGAAAANVALSVLACLLATWLGWSAMAFVR